MKNLTLIILLNLSNLIKAQCTIDLSMWGIFVDEQSKDTVELAIIGMEVTFKDIKGFKDKGSISKIEIHTTVNSVSYTMITFLHNWEYVVLIVSPKNKDSFSVFSKFEADQYGDYTIPIMQTFNRIRR